MIIEEASLAHYGTPRRSGRYPWGSGEQPFQNVDSFLGHIKGLKDKGMSETEIASALGVTTTQLRAHRSIAKNEKRQADIAMAQRLKDQAWSNVAIGERMGINESSVRSLLAPGAKDKADILMATGNMLKDQVDQKGYIDVGSSVERHVGVSRGKLDNALAQLEAEGYSVHTVKVQQVGTGEFTTMKVLAPPGTTQKDVWMNRDNIRQIEEFSEDGGRTYLGLHKPLDVASDRIQVVYGPDGGADADGVIYVRPGTKDLSMGGANYAQVRIAVDGSHYLKGMAVYKDDLPDGVDLQFNTNKKDTGNKLDAMKKMKTDADGNIDPDNPFGSSIKRQIVDVDGNGKERVISAMNVVNEEGDWNNWSRNLSTQMLSKQSVTLAESQLNTTYDRKRREFDEINSLTNPEVKRQLMDEFAESADSSAVHLKAAALPRQATQVILPVNSMRDTEIYAPNYKNGERVVLVRYPHGGTFEIPELTVNNKNPEAKKLMGNAKDAVGINARVAERMSGADFDGDSVLVIPNNSNKVKSTAALKGLKEFDPQSAYPGYEGMPKMTSKQKANEMGRVSNLINDMNIAGADGDEVARAVRHSMVVIDAEKHNLNYKQSYSDNGIADLNKKYQGKAAGGAATLISRATSPKHIDERRPRRAKDGGPVDKTTGEKVYEKTGATYIDKKGREKKRTMEVDKLADTKDARTLSSGSPMEEVYANHSNRLKALANQARKESVNTKPTPYSPSAKKAYTKEVDSLNAKLNVAKKNEPRERQAQIVANSVVSSKRKANPGMEADEVKKVKSQALNAARVRTGASKTRINITDKEWEAIQAGAVSTHKLREILRNSDKDRVRDLAMPKQQKTMTSTQTARARAMLNSGYTQAEVADALGVSVSTINNAVA